MLKQTIGQKAVEQLTDTFRDYIRQFRLWWPYLNYINLFYRKGHFLCGSKNRNAQISFSQTNIIHKVGAMQLKEKVPDPTDMCERVSDNCGDRVRQCSVSSGPYQF